MANIVVEQRSDGTRKVSTEPLNIGTLAPVPLHPQEARDRAVAHFIRRYRRVFDEEMARIAERYPTNLYWVVGRIVGDEEE